MVARPTRRRTVPFLFAAAAGLAASVALAATLTGRGPAPTPSGPAPAGLVTRFDDEASPPSAAGEVSWRTFWVLCWDAYAGADRFETRTLTGEGASPRLTVRRDRCLRIEAAAGASPPAAVDRERALLLASQQGQLAVQVRAVLAGGHRSEWSQPVAVGSG